MTSLLLRRSASLSSKRIATVASLINAVHFSSLSSSSPSSKNEQFTRNGGEIATGSCSVPRFGGAGTRSFHAGSALNIRASSVVSQRAGYAVADFSDEDKSSSSSSSSGDGLEISKLGISQEIVTALAKKGITKLFPIQKAVLEPAMKGRDMIGRARTGTGKTLAFGIPIMDKIIKSNASNGRQRNPLALILAPTRELARQVDKEFYESAPNLDTLCVYGGVPISRQMSTLDRGVDVIVGTPGRVIDLLKRGALNLSQVKFVVLDEADQMLNVGFADDVETILEHLPKKRQGMMFSATMPSWIVKLTRKYLNDPLTIDLVGDSDQKLADGITLFSITTETYDKPSIIGPLIMEHAKGGKCIVFTQRKRDADQLAHALKGSLKCEPLHGDISQIQRERTLSGFRDGHFNVLCATDVAARGLDVPNVDLVIHYELPNSSETFVHRSGRTGRAGKKGSVILMYSSHEYRDVKGLAREVGCNFTELPKIAVEPGARTMLGGYGSGFSSSGRGGGRFGNSSYGAPSNFGSSFGSSFERKGGFGGSNSGQSRGGFGGRSGGFGSGHSGGFGFGSERSGSFGNTSGSGNPSSGHTSGFGEFASDRSPQYGNTPSSQSSGGRFGRFGENKNSSQSSGGRFGGFGEDKDW